MNREKHGGYCASIVDRVHCLSVIGSWNYEGMLAYLEEFREVARPLIIDGQAWASLVDLREWGLSTPETVIPFNQAAKWASINNRDHIAIVAEENSVLRWLIEQMLKDTFVKCRFFVSRLEAWTWLMELKYCEDIPLLAHQNDDCSQFS